MDVLDETHWLIEHVEDRYDETAPVFPLDESRLEEGAAPIAAVREALALLLAHLSAAYQGPDDPDDVFPTQTDTEIALLAMRLYRQMP